MNCHEWRAKITANVSVAVQYTNSGEGYTVSGGGTVTHGGLYTGWTRRELQCFGYPISEEQNWILREPNLCFGRAFVRGILTPSSKIKLTTTITGQPPFETEHDIYWQAAFDQYQIREGLLPLDPYPDWENDPYSVAYRKQIDALPVGTFLVGLFPAEGLPSPAMVPIKWFKDGESGGSPDGTTSASLSVKFTLT